MIERVGAALAQIPAERRGAARLIYTAHSIPQAMADTCRLRGATRGGAPAGLARVSGPTRTIELAYQSRSGPPHQPWLEPDIGDALRQLHAAGQTRDVVIVPIGFLSDHIEILFDLDTEARGLCEQLGLNMVRAATVGSHPQFVTMIRELIEERIAGAPRRALGTLGPSHDECPSDCCKYTPSRGK